MSLSELNQAQKEELTVSLAVLACHDAGLEITAEALSAAIEASGNKVASYLPGLFSDLIGRGLTIDKCLAGPSAGGAPAAGAAAASGDAAPAAEEEEEEEEADMGGGMDMFGGEADY